MSDLIKREDAIKAVSEPFDRKYWQYTTRSIRDTVKALKDIPSAEPKKVCIGQVHFDDEKLHEIVNEAVKKLKEEIEPKQGTYRDSGEDDEWYGHWAICNECGAEWMGDENFCPNCGCRMKGADNE